MTQAEYLRWHAQAIARYAADKVASGQWSREESLERSAREHAELLPLGLASPDNFLFTVVDPQGEPVGVLWYGLQRRFGDRVAYVYEIDIVPQRRRQGHALRAFRALEAEVRAQGLAGLALHVFGHNAAARALYEKLGFLPTNISLFRAVGARGDPGRASRSSAAHASGAR
jgi:ribosomal protein S18 acetylase RimI-like enzyme